MTMKYPIMVSKALSLKKMFQFFYTDFFYHITNGRDNKIAQKHLCIHMQVMFFLPPVFDTDLRNCQTKMLQL